MQTGHSNDCCPPLSRTMMESMCFSDKDSMFSPLVLVTASPGVTPPSNLGHGLCEGATLLTASVQQNKDDIIMISPANYCR